MFVEFFSYASYPRLLLVDCGAQLVVYAQFVACNTSTMGLPKATPVMHLSHPDPRALFACFPHRILLTPRPSLARSIGRHQGSLVGIVPVR